MASSIQKKATKTVTCFDSLQTSQLEQPAKLWRELKVHGKNIQRRSYHTCVLHDNRIYVYGGYDINVGILDDFRSAQLNEAWVEWKQIAGEDQQGYPGKRYSHTAVCYKEEMVLFGGKISCLGNTNELNFYSFAEQRWLERKVNGQVPPLDSHSAVIWKGTGNDHSDSMWVFGGFIGGKVGKYSNTFYQLDLKQLEWRELAITDKLKPSPRANCSMVLHEDHLVVFGGGDLSSKFKDMWKYNPNVLRWQKLQNHPESDPESREGHTLTSFQNKLILFGGIHQITHQKNDVVVYSQGRWHTLEEQASEQQPPTEEHQLALSLHQKKIEEMHNSNEFKSKRHYRQLKQLNYNTRSTEHHTATQQKSKNDIRKHHLLKEFELTPEERERFRDHSPTLESLKSSITAIGSGNPFKKLATGEPQLKHLQKINNKKRPCARDGHTACLYGNGLVIFGGDRHMMSFNDLYVLDLMEVTEQPAHN